MFSATTVLTLLLLLILASVVYFMSKRVRVPYTVLLVLVGLLLVPLVQIPILEPVLGSMTKIVLTPELLFFIFLPMLIFESAFNMNMRRMLESAWSIGLLAVVGLIISTTLIATLLYLLLPLVGLSIPFIVALLFGAIISSTDPVAVLALFKEYGAPKRLTLIFEGESLFNDGTAVALFLVVLAVAEHGFHGTETIVEGIETFLMMVFLGVLFGALMAAIFSRVLRRTRSNEFVSITLLIVSAHLVFVLSELINSHGIFGIELHVSAIIATTVSSLFLGNYARHSLSPRSDEYLNKSIEHLAFVANSLVFLLAGILFATTDINLSVLLVPILITILVVALARAISVFAVIVPLNRLKLEAPIPRAWQLVLSWGSLRGALAIIIVLLIPEDLTVSGWSHAFTPRDLLLSLTIGCILATLFLKAPTIGPLVRRLGIDRPSSFREAHYNYLGFYYLLTEKARLDEQRTRGFIRKEHYAEIKQKVESKISDTIAERQRLEERHGTQLFERVLRGIALDIEIRYLKELYGNTEVDETVYRRIKGKLNIQKDEVEHHLAKISMPLLSRRKVLFDRLMLVVQSRMPRQGLQSPEEQYQYYRAQSIIARKVIKTLTQMQEQYARPVFDPVAYETVIEMYERHRRSTTAHMSAVLQAHESELSDYTASLSMKSVHSSGNKSFVFMSARGIATEQIAEDIERIYAV